MRLGMGFVDELGEEIAEEGGFGLADLIPRRRLDPQKRFQDHWLRELWKEIPKLGPIRLAEHSEDFGQQRFASFPQTPILPFA